MLLDKHQNGLINPKDNDHFVLLYENNQCRDESIITYINEGLKRDQLCFYCTVELDRETANWLHDQIIDYSDNIENGNLGIIDLKPFYMSAIRKDLTIFNELRDTVVTRVKERADKHVRFVGDAATYLLTHMHFEEFEMLEQWWQTKPFKGSYLCPYNKYLIEKVPYKAYQHTLMHILHDIVIECPPQNP